MPQLTLDKTDIKILQVLQENGRLTNVELSERVALSPSPCLRRLKQLEDAGIVRQYAALLSPESVNLGLQAFIRVSIRKAKDAREDFAASVASTNSVTNNIPVPMRKAISRNCTSLPPMPMSAHTCRRCWKDCPKVRPSMPTKATTARKTGNI
ncbi:leucine-responsive regulatory protein [Neisseria meningitidis]|nr:leucine-responsive regulatory protein [Neisseria meningitidis]